MAGWPSLLSNERLFLLDEENQRLQQKYTEGKVNDLDYNLINVQMHVEDASANMIQIYFTLANYSDNPSLFCFVF